MMVTSQSSSSLICKPTDYGPVVPTTPLVIFLQSVQETALKTFGSSKFDPKLYVDLSLKYDLPIVKKAFNDLPKTENGSVLVSDFNGFLEVYYWDSYWVIRGLLASKMYETAKGIVLNLIDLIDTYGYVLNGARAYYTNRSSMVVEVYKRTNDMDLVKKALPALIKEHKFWNSGIHSVTIEDDQGLTHNLSRYYAMWNQPRPESFTIDTETADKLKNDCEKEQLYRELASTAETGWDFSTRWMKNTSDLATLTTTTIVPVDLNAFVLKMELDITFLANVTGETSHALHFNRASKARKKAMDTVFWNAEKGQWFDYWLNDSSSGKDVYKWDASNQNQDIFASNFIPLWIESFNSDETVVKKAAQSLESSGLLHAAGLVRSGSKEARSLAKDIAIRWIRTNYATYKTSKAMHEKYDVSKCGDFGGGGEYVPQTGFGWSNGVVLAFLEEFGWAEDLSPQCNNQLKLDF
uniref:Trehalase n=1 Tax=Tanacetum cinerariifolium TaxID=118510 RepID=A0A699HWT9_TANCI|nr:probable trehalase isoform X1 [Tanacetum cinerariifolium]